VVGGGGEIFESEERISEFIEVLDEEFDLDLSI
jgi:hypothetical protein